MSTRSAALFVLFLTLPTFALEAQGPYQGCQVGNQLGATLLFPFFEVDLGNPAGQTTLISINNAESAAALVHLVLWTDWDQPTLSFDIFLGPYDLQTLNLRDVLNGDLPLTGASPGIEAFPFCGAGDLRPPTVNPALTGTFLEQLRADHRGVLGPRFGNCVGSPQADGFARGYITVDSVNRCTGTLAGNPVSPKNAGGYFVDGGGGVANNNNWLWGDLIFVNPAQNSAQGVEAVALWASSTVFSGTNIFTFYGRFSGWNGGDDRVPLPWSWNQRFLNGGTFAGGANFIIWQDPLQNLAAPAGCGEPPVGLPIPMQFDFRDEDGQDQRGTNPSYLVTQRNGIPFAELLPYAFGQMRLTRQDAGTPAPMWVIPTLSAEGRFSAGWNGHAESVVCGRTPPVFTSLTGAPADPRY
jgi:hypothetical protein